MALNLKQLQAMSQKKEEPKQVEQAEQVKPEVASQTKPMTLMERLKAQSAAKKVAAVESKAAESESKPPVTPVDNSANDSLGNALVQTEILAGPEGFKQKLAHLDSLFVAGTGYTTLVIDQARRSVADLMIELKENPEYGQLLLDSDIRNIVAYAQQVSSAVHKTTVEKKAKSTAKSKKQAAFAGAFDFGGLESAAADSNRVKPAPAVGTFDLSGLSTMNTDKIGSREQ